MALNPAVEFPGKINAPNAAYPFGSARNVTIPGDGTGTPFLDTLVNDVFGFQQALLDAAGIVPSGAPDQVGASQYLDALVQAFGRKTDNVASLVADVSFKAGEIINTRGYTTAEDKGQNSYLARAVTGATADGGSLIKSTGNPAIEFVGLFPDGINDKQFGTIGDKVANDTNALLAFFNYCIATISDGHITEGDYLVTAGILIFDNGHVDTPWPVITTAGHDAVTFFRASDVDSPLLTLSNGTPTSGVGKFWFGGHLGGITFDQNGQTTSSNQHGLSLTGTNGTTFGWMKAEDPGGSCIFVPLNLFGGTNPDPFSNSFLSFLAVECNRGKRYAVENQNFVGFTAVRIGYLRVIECVLGGFFGLGAGNSVDVASMGSVGGVAFDDGTFIVKTGGGSSRFKLGIAELDDVEQGFSFNACQSMDCGLTRFVHRFNFSSLNPSGGYWPRKTVDMAGGAAPSAVDLFGSFVHRLESGGVLADLGTFIDGNSNGSGADFNFNNEFIDNGSLGFTEDLLAQNIAANEVGVVLRRGHRILDTRIRVAALVRSSTANSVPNSGYATISAKLTFATELYDLGGYYDSSDSSFLVPYDGLYRVIGKFALNMAVGTRVRMAFATDVTGTIVIRTNKNMHQQTATVEHYDLIDVISLTKGQKVFLMADQNTGGAVNFSTPISANADLTWSIESL